MLSILSMNVDRTSLNSGIDFAFEKTSNRSKMIAVSLFTSKTVFVFH